MIAMRIQRQEKAAIDPLGVARQHAERLWCRSIWVRGRHGRYGRRQEVVVALGMDRYPGSAGTGCTRDATPHTRTDWRIKSLFDTRNDPTASLQILTLLPETTFIRPP